MEIYIKDNSIKILRQFAMGCIHMETAGDMKANLRLKNVMV